MFRIFLLVAALVTPVFIKLIASVDDWSAENSRVWLAIAPIAFLLLVSFAAVARGLPPRSGDWLLLWLGNSVFIGSIGLAYSIYWAVWGSGHATDPVRLIAAWAFVLSVAATLLGFLAVLFGDLHQSLYVLFKQGGLPSVFKELLTQVPRLRLKPQVGHPDRDHYRDHYYRTHPSACVSWLRCG